MKIVLNSNKNTIFSDFLNMSNNRKDNIEIIDASVERNLSTYISIGDVNVFVLDSSNTYCQRAVDLIKKKHRFIPIIILEKNHSNISNADIYIPYQDNHTILYSSILKNINSFEKNFAVLNKLTTKSKIKIEFDEFIYDPSTRILYYKDKQFKLSDKAGGILELLCSNFEKLITKDIILQKVWLKNDHFSSRSMDVYLTGLRNLFKNNEINLTIKTISKAGLILTTY